MIEELIICILFFIILIFIGPYFITREFKQIYYYTVPSSIDYNFPIEVNRIIQNSTIPGKYNVIETKQFDQADITIELKTAEFMDKFVDTVEYYPGTNKKIRFSVTTQNINTKPKIYIDAINWMQGVKESGLSLEKYRNYVIVHEFMHALGHEHVKCDENHHTVVNGQKVCPVLYQSTRGCPDGFLCGYAATQHDFNANKIPVRYVR